MLEGRIMEYLLAIMVLIMVATIVVFVIIKSRKENSNDLDGFGKALEVENIQENKMIPIEWLLPTEAIDDEKLFEITDSTVIARISATIPNTAQVAAKTVTNNALKNVELYKAIIPSGVKLAESKQIEGAVRGFYRGTKGIKGQANLVKIDPTKISKAASVANSAANIMNVGSLVVGQYYMAEIDAKLETMNKNISKIGDFQDREFKSRILSLLSRVGEVSQFSSEILESDDLRNRKLQALDDLKGICTDLLQQVNETIADVYNKNSNMKFREYQEKVDEINTLLNYQNILITILEEISKLTYLLGKGEVSIDFSYFLFNTYLERSIQIRTTLQQWHTKQVESLKIDLDNNRVSKSGIEGFFSKIPGLVDDNWNYKELQQGLNEKISTQSQDDSLAFTEPEEVYSKDVPIVIKDGKYYYLH